MVHLKRFDFSHAGKLSHFVTYPETLSLKTLVADLPILNSAASANANNDIKLLKNTSYKLYGVLVHLGYTCKSGHYYSYVRGPNNAWYKADDTRVSKKKEIFLYLRTFICSFLTFELHMNNYCPSILKINHVNNKINICEVWF